MMMKKDLTIFDIDETLFETTAMIRVVKDGSVVKHLTNQEFNTYELEDGETFDFSEFKDSEKFFHESKPITGLIQKLKEAIANNECVKVVTARCDFDNKDRFLDTFRKHEIDIDKVYVYRAGNMDNSIPTAVKKAIIIAECLQATKYNRVKLFDDSIENLKEFLSLKTKFNAVEFEAHYVAEGMVQEIQ